MHPLVAARELTSQFGYSAVPVGHLKQPLLPSAELAEFLVTPPTTRNYRDWLRRFPRANAALVCGVVSNVIVVDVEREGLIDFMDEPMGRTVFSYSPNGGRHLYFRYEPGIPILAMDDGGTRLADLKSDNSFVMLPPSVADRRRYEWGISPWEAEPNEIPAFVHEWVRHAGGAQRDLGRVLARSTRADGRGHGHASRSEADISDAVQMLASGAAPEQVLEMLFSTEAAIARRRQRGDYAQRTLARAAEWVNELIPNTVVMAVSHRCGSVALTLRVLGGRFEGRVLRMDLDSPPSDRSKDAWTQLEKIVGVDLGGVDRAALRRLHGLRLAVQLRLRGDGGLALGRVYPARPGVIEV